jgi:hypothetical protein
MPAYQECMLKILTGSVPDYTVRDNLRGCRISNIQDIWIAPESRRIWKLPSAESSGRVADDTDEAVVNATPLGPSDLPEADFRPEWPNRSLYELRVIRRELVIVSPTSAGVMNKAAPLWFVV